MDTRFGHPDDWGLSPERHSEIANELSDHLDCLQADEGGDAAQAAEAKLATPWVRRRISSAHIADQLTTTLLRWPTSVEWREWMWLGFWIVLLVGGVLASAHLDASHAMDSNSFWATGSYNISTVTIQQPILFYADTLVWLLAGCGIAGLISQLLLISGRAWQKGKGVLLARILHLNTILVTVGILAVTLLKSTYSSPQFPANVEIEPVLNVYTYSIGVVIIIAASLILRPQRLWPIALFCTLLWAGTVLTAPVRSDVICTFAHSASMSDVSVQSYLDKRWQEHGYTLVDGGEYQIVSHAFVLHCSNYMRVPYTNWHEDVPASMVVDKLTVASLATAPLHNTLHSLMWLFIPIPLTAVVVMYMLMLFQHRLRTPARLSLLLLGTVSLCFLIAPFLYSLMAIHVGHSPNMSFWHSTLMRLNLLPFDPSFGPLPGLLRLLRDSHNPLHVNLKYGLLFASWLPWLMLYIISHSSLLSHKAANPDMETT
ncbi:MAG: hypothetical protein R3F46_01580 [bacterium]